jgi:hypothetical protein
MRRPMDEKEDKYKKEGTWHSAETTGERDSNTARKTVVPDSSSTRTGSARTGMEGVKEILIQNLNDKPDKPSSDKVKPSSSASSDPAFTTAASEGKILVEQWIHGVSNYWEKQTKEKWHESSRPAVILSEVPRENAGEGSGIASDFMNSDFRDGVSLEESDAFQDQCSFVSKEKLDGPGASQSLLGGGADAYSWLLFQAVNADRTFTKAKRDVRRKCTIQVDGTRELRRLTVEGRANLSADKSSTDENGDDDRRSDDSDDSDSISVITPDSPDGGNLSQTATNPFHVCQCEADSVTIHSQKHRSSFLNPANAYEFHYLPSGSVAPSR